jgi:sulfite reductase alpha subunit-like flavoprotein
LQIAVIGLGDSNYSKFNFVAKKLHRRLLQLGAHEYFPRVLADEQHNMGIDGVAIKWIDGLMDKLMTDLPTTEPIISADVLPPARYRVC